MEFLQMKIGQYCDGQKQAEKQEGIRDAAGNYFPISFSSSSHPHGSASYSNHQRLWMEPTFDITHVAEEDAPRTRRSYHGGAALGSSAGTKIQEVEVIEYLTPTSATTTHDVIDHHESYKVHGAGGGGGGSGGNSSSTMEEEREHMFDKVVTPSDVGKLNRLVIPKQHAERYFPLIANEKGLLLNFEDRNGKPWRFRYSYWNSSQSYVITKGWSRFVKEKQLDAGDVVSFQRGAGESGKGRLYIDWRRQRLHPPPPPDHHHHHVLHVHQPTASSPALSSIPSSARFCLQPVPNYNSMYTPIISPHNNNNENNNKTKQRESCSSGGGISQYYCDINFRRLAPPHHQIEEVPQHQPPMIVNSSVPVVHHSNAAAAAPKRLRLFGVNMDCSSISIPQESRGQLVLPSVPYVNSSRPSGFFPLRQSSMLYDGAPLILPSTPQP